MAQSAKAQESKAQESKAEGKTLEPSMEEILASIRRIIADEDVNASAPEPADLTKAESKPVAAVSSPTGISQLPDSAPPTTTRRFGYESLAISEAFGAQKADDTAKTSAAILDLTESMASPVAQPSEPATVLKPKTSAAPQPQAPDRQTGANADKTNDRLPMPSFGEGASGGEEPKRLMSPETSAAVDSAFNALAKTVLVHNARTLEDLVREMLRPLLKSWLDDNLPRMVERLIRAEIERVSRGRSD